MPHRARFLGFAFANADFLFETDDRGLIQFAAGAARDLVREDSASLMGTPAANLFKPSDGEKFSYLSTSLKDGGRAGPFQLTLATGAKANLALLRLGENQARISCTLARPDSHVASDPVTGLASREDFLAAAGAAGPEHALTLVNVPGLPELCGQLTSDNAQALMARIGELLRDSGAGATGQLSETSFGALSPTASGPLGLVKQISAAITGKGLHAPKISEARVGLEGPGLSSEQRLLSLRYVVNRFSERGHTGGENDIAGAFERMMDETQLRLTEMARTVNKGAFEIAYQPICNLKTGKLSHYEALARFSNSHGTGDTIKFIEALGIANALDLAVASRVLDSVAKTESHIAFNISGATLASPASFSMLATLLARRRKLAPRTLIEITETSAIENLDDAARAVSALRAMGYRVGLDDFGAGAASLNYLHAIPVDFVKFDGALIQKIGQSARDDAMLAGMAKLCAELGVPTIAEWIESQEQAQAAQALGFTEGQGRFLGAPSLEITNTRQVNAHRHGVRESWG